MTMTTELQFGQQEGHPLFHLRHPEQTLFEFPGRLSHWLEVFAFGPIHLVSVFPMRGCFDVDRKKEINLSTWGNSVEYSR
jgi:hypothetical protein